MHQVGVIGLGVMGNRMIDAMLADPRFTVACAWDLNSLRMEVLQKHHPEVALAEHAHDLASRDNLDLVYIATPPTTHIHYINLAFNHQKAVLCEKPLAVDVAATRALVANVNAHQWRNAVNFPFATSPAVTAIEKAIHTKEMGELLRIEIRFHFSQWPRAWQRAGAWLNQREEGGFVREVFSHFAYLTQRLIGPTALQSTHVTYPEEHDRAETYASARMQSSDLPVYFSGGVGGAGPDLIEWTLYGTEKSYRLLNWRILQAGKDEGWVEITPEEATMHDHFTEVVNMIAGRSHKLADFAAALKVQELVEAVLAGGLKRATEPSNEGQTETMDKARANQSDEPQTETGSKLDEELFDKDVTEAEKITEEQSGTADSNKDTDSTE